MSKEPRRDRGHISYFRGRLPVTSLESNIGESSQTIKVLYVRLRRTDQLRQSELQAVQGRIDRCTKIFLNRRCCRRMSHKTQKSMGLGCVARSTTRSTARSRVFDNLLRKCFSHFNRPSWIPLIKKLIVKCLWLSFMNRNVRWILHLWPARNQRRWMDRQKMQERSKFSRSGLDGLKTGSTNLPEHCLVQRYMFRRKKWRQKPEMHIATGWGEKYMC